MEEFIRSLNPNIDSELLKYLVNYFRIIIQDNLLPNDVLLDDVIRNVVSLVDKIYFYKEDDEIYKKLGPDVKGFRDEKNRIIYVNDKLTNPLRDITIYHEIHHFAQTNIMTGNVGINQEGNIGRLVMEAQTQYVAEKIYSEINGIDFETKEFRSEELRMLPGGTVISNLHNYQLYDNLLSKLAIMLGVSKDYFVTINYQYKNNKGLKELEERYKECQRKYEYPKDFYSMLFDFDYIYVVDYLVYLDNPEKELIKSGGETETYQIYPELGKKVSLSLQKKAIDYIDREYLISLLSNNGNYMEFYKYMIDDNNREILSQFIGNKKKDITTE